MLFFPLKYQMMLFFSFLLNVIYFIKSNAILLNIECFLHVHFMRIISNPIRYSFDNLTVYKLFAYCICLIEFTSCILMHIFVSVNDPKNNKCQTIALVYYNKYILVVLEIYKQNKNLINLNEYYCTPE